MDTSMETIELLRENLETFPKGGVDQWWRVGPLTLTLSNDVRGGWYILYSHITQGRIEYTSEDDDYAPFRAVCAAADIPYLVEDNGVLQMLFSLPDAHVQRFFVGLLEYLRTHPV